MHWNGCYEFPSDMKKWKHCSNQIEDVAVFVDIYSRDLEKFGVLASGL